MGTKFHILITKKYFFSYFNFIRNPDMTSGQGQESVYFLLTDLTLALDKYRS